MAPNADAQRYICRLIVMLLLLGAPALGSCGPTATAAAAQAGRAPATPEPLTPDEKAADMERLLTLATEIYPYLDIIGHWKGVEVFGAGTDLVEAARQTANDTEHIQLVSALVHLLEQGTGHMDITAPWSFESAQERGHIRALYGISEAALDRQRYWWDLLEQTRRRTHAEPRVHYRAGSYVFVDDVSCGATTVAAQSAIIAVDGMDVHSYALSLADRLWLRYDVAHGRPFLPGGSPFVVPGNRAESSWTVTLRLPGDEQIECAIPKRQGRRPRPEPAGETPNVTTSRLADDVGYIRVSSFSVGAQRDGEIAVIRDFISDLGDETKLIIDVRGNSGGSPTYWEDALVRPLLTSEAQLLRYSAMRTAAHQELWESFERYRQEEAESFASGTIERIDRSAVPGAVHDELFDEQDWVFFRTRRTYQPIGPGYRGRVYVLVDNDVFSATEDFVRAVKALDIGRVVGSRTAGGAANTIAPWFFELPHSHILLLMQVEASFNPDGAPNDPFGTVPDVELSASTYPTPLPEAMTPEAVLADPWVQWVLSDSAP